MRIVRILWLAAVLATTAQSFPADATTTTATTAAKWTHERTVDLGSGSRPSQVVVDAKHHRLYIDTMGNLEVVNTRTWHVIGRPIDSMGFSGLVPDLRHNRVYVIPNGESPRPMYLRVVRGDRILATVRLPIPSMQSPDVSTLVDPNTGYLYLDMTYDAEHPASLWVLDGKKILAKIATGLRTVPELPMPRVAATDDIYVPGAVPATTAGQPPTYELLTIHGTNIVHRMRVAHYPSGVIIRGRSTYVVSGSFFDHYQDGRLVSSAAVDSGWSAAVANNGTAYLETGDYIAIVQGDSVDETTPGQIVYFDPSAQDAYALGTRQVTALHGTQIITRVPNPTANSVPEKAWYDAATREMFVFGLHQTLVFSKGIVVQRLNTGVSACAANGGDPVYITSCGNGRLTVWNTK